MGVTTTVFVDRDGDELSVTARNVSGNRSGDPIITVRHGKCSQSVVFIEAEVPSIIIRLIKTLNLDRNQIRHIMNDLEQEVK